MDATDCESLFTATEKLKAEWALRVYADSGQGGRNGA